MSPLEVGTAAAMTQKVHGLCRESCRLCEPLLATRFPPIICPLPAVTGEEPRTKGPDCDRQRPGFFLPSPAGPYCAQYHARCILENVNQLAEPPDSPTALSPLTWRQKTFWNERREPKTTAQAILPLGDMICCVQLSRTRTW